MTRFGLRFLVRFSLLGAAALAALGLACSRRFAGLPYPSRLSPVAVAVTAAGEPVIGHTESYDRISDNPFLEARDNPLSTFSIDVDTASYANVRRFLDGGRLPPPDAVRIEELVNYFRTADAAPADGKPLAVRTEVATCPWAPGHRLMRIAVRARGLPAQAPPPRRNLVFLIDTSGSMDEWNKLPLVIRSLRLLSEQLREDDRIAIVTYAGAAGLALPATPGSDHAAIAAALERLAAGGSTNGGAGIGLAYQVAEQSFIQGGVNRVVLATDGDFNVGVSSPGALERLIEEERDHGVSLTALGFGMGNYKDSTMENLADHGNGNYAYIDTFAEARKVLVEDLSGTLVTVAKDVKIRVEMNPRQVRRYRLLGYEDRLLRKEQFDDDRADAGELGADQNVTALYEIEPAGGAAGPTAPLRYQEAPALSGASGSGELCTVAVRWKEPDGQKSRLASWTVRDSGRGLAEASRDFRFATAVTAFGLVLRQSPHRGTATPALALALARGAADGSDPHQREFVALAEKARALGAKSD
jgi:Ca-activated chloride channel family protein